MKRIVFDIETDGLRRATADGKPKLTQLFCVVTKDIDTGEVKRWFEGKLPGTQADGGFFELGNYLGGADRLIGHNSLGYDVPVLFGYGILIPDPQVCWDTLVLSHLMYPRIGDNDGRTSRIPKQLWGRHSLEAWGWRLHLSKGDYSKQENAFTELTDELVEYCVRDVEITARLYQFFEDKNIDPRAVDLEHRFARRIQEMMHRGFPFDVDAAETLLVDVEQNIARCDTLLHEELGPLVTVMKTKTKIAPLNLGSTLQLTDRLQEKYGWEPEVFTPSGRPQFDEKIITALPDSIPIKPLLLERQRFIGARKRLIGAQGKENGLLQAAVSHDDEPGMWVHHYCNHNGARTGRCTHSHPNVNFPRVGNPWGEEFRGMVKAPEGHVIVGCDMSGVDARMIAHLLAPYDGGRMIRMILEGNLHDKNQEIMAEIMPNITRSIGKNVFYATCYGAKAKRVGSTAGTGPKKGGALRKLIRHRVEGLDDLIKDVEEKTNERGYLLGIDGRVLYPEAAFSALNTISQSAAALVMKEATDMVMSWIDTEGMDAQLVLHVHDEGQILVGPYSVPYADEIGKAFVTAIEEAGKKWHIRCPLTGEYKIGSSWAETH